MKDIPRTLPRGRGRENRVKYVSGNSYEELCKKLSPGRALYAMFTIRLTRDEIAEDLRTHGVDVMPEAIGAINVTRILHVGHPEDFEFATRRHLGDLKFFTIGLDAAREWAGMTA